MFKLTGAVLVLSSTVFISSQKVLEYYCTYKFLNMLSDIIKRIQFENTTNMTYTDVFRKIEFDKKSFLKKAKTNGYIVRSEIKAAETFFDNLGKRDTSAEKHYIDFNLQIFTNKSREYKEKHNQIKKTHLLCGIAAGLLIIIVLI